MDELERVTNSVYGGYFVDLYVRVSNEIAVRMYEGMGYTVYRRVVEYYSAGLGEIEEDAYGGLIFSAVPGQRTNADWSDRYEKTDETGQETEECPREWERVQSTPTRCLVGVGEGISFVGVRGVA